MTYLMKQEKLHGVSHHSELVRAGNTPIQRGLNRIGVILVTFGVLVLSLQISPPARAQVTGATVSGTVSDTSGAVIPNGQLAIKNVATGVITTVDTNKDGFYRASNLIPGNYEITITASGFETEVRTGIVLEVGAQVVQNDSLKVGTVTQKVEVTAASPDVQLASSTIGNTVSSYDVVELPLNGRSWSDLADLEPGVVLLQSQNQQDTASNAASRAEKGFAAQSSIDGGRPSENNYRLDGISINDRTNGAASDVIGETPGVDSIQEFSVLTSNYSAEYGNTSGGVINSVTRSGTNQLHGTVYDFLRNDALDARTYFDGPQIPPFRRNQFGGSIGAPIRKNRMFFFANYEGLRQLQALTTVNLVPSSSARAGTLCSQPALVASGTSCTTSTVTVNAAAAAYLPFWPLPNAGLESTGHGDVGYFDFVDPEVSSSNYVTARFDDVISDKDHIDGTYVFQASPFTLPDSLDNLVDGIEDNFQIFAIEETHVFTDHLVNTARVGAFRQFDYRGKFIAAINPLATNSALTSQPGYDASAVAVSGLTGFGGGALGLGTVVEGTTTPQLYDDASWVHGTHTMKFGFAAEMQEYNFSLVNTAGAWTFGSLTGFLTNAAGASYKGILTSPVSLERGFRDNVLGGYVQDDWHLNRYLALNLGVRYEMMTNPTDTRGYLTSLTSMTSATFRLGNPMFESNPTLKNWEPRLGFAWDPLHDGKTSVRGGFGLFDVEPESWQWVSNILSVAPYAIQYTASSLPAGAFYNGVGQYLTPATETVMYLRQNPPRSYVMQRNFSVQREITPNLTMTLAYAGANSEHLRFSVSDGDAVYPTATSAGYLEPNPIGSGTRINTNWGRILQFDYTSPAFYNSLQVNVRKRLSRGFQIEGSFTWQKSIDNISDAIASNDFSTTLVNPMWWAPNASRALSDFNLAKILVINGVWEIPQDKSFHGVVDKVVNGWQLGGIFKVGNGMPFTPTFGTGGNVAGFNNSGQTQYDLPDRLFTGAGCKTATNPKQIAYVNVNCFTLPTAPSMDYWTANCDHTSKVYGSSKTVEPYPVCFNLIGNAGRNTLIGPGLADMDFSVNKNTRFGGSERFNAQFRTEFFNIFNRPNFAPPTEGTTTDLFNSAGVQSGSAGQLTEMQNSLIGSRQIQFSLKLIW